MYPTIDLEKTGQNITSLRKNSGLSVRRLQEIFGFSTPQAIYKWQKGMALPSVDHLVILARIFGISIDDIIEIKDVLVRTELQCKS